VEILEAVKKIQFIFNLLKDIGGSVKLPIVLRTDNFGAIFIADDAISGVST
jgi:hypothetical protein